jgi:hypothetical protein
MRASKLIVPLTAVTKPEGARRGGGAMLGGL